MAELTHSALLKAIKNLSEEAQLIATQLEERALTHRAVAEDTASVSEMIAAMGVDKTTVEECRELANLVAQVGESQKRFSGAVKDFPPLADSAYQAAKREDGGIQEAVRTAPVDATDMDRNWFRQT